MRRIFITGGSSGIGRALAIHYLRAGCTVGVTARRRSAIDELASDASPGVVAAYCADVRHGTDMAEAAKDFCGRFGLPDVVIANAGISHGTLTEELADVDVFQAILDTNVIGLVRTFQPFVAPMREAGRGTLAGVASVAGIRGLPGAGAYSASKAAAIAYLESLRVELRGTGVRVVSLLPGYIATPMTSRNPYRMPFLISADEAAPRLARAIDRGAARTVVPWQMGLVASVLRWLPIGLYDRLAVRAPRKPRRAG